MPSTPTGSHFPSPALLTFDDIAADLVWPRLLRAPALALRPARLGLAFVYFVGIVLLGMAMAGIDPGVAVSVTLVEPGTVARSLYQTFVAAPVHALSTHPIRTLLGGAAALVWTAVFGGAICRLAATEFALGMSLPWPAGLGFALSRLRSLIGALLLPALLVWAIALCLALGGWVLFSLPVLNVVGGLLWPFFLLAGLVAAAVMMAYVLAKPMLVPGVACEGTDAIDAVQHAYSFVFSRPVRLVLYLLVLVALAVVTGFIAFLVAHLLVRFAQASAGAWTPDSVDRVITGTLSGTAPRTDRAAAWLVRLFTLVPFGLAAAYLISLYWTGSTLLYLAMRRVCDGQDMHEVWVPGMVEGTMAESLRGRAAPAPTTEAVVDNGPADET